jgi:hypothetical protein
VQLRYIDLGKLIAEAGGDPWAVNKSLQSGRPAQVSDLAEAFHNAGQCTTEASSAFLEARRRFEAAWNRDNGDHPINDSAEVQRATESLGVQAAQLPRIAVDLENVAANLAEAQRSAGGQIATLENRLQTLDDWIGQAEDLIRHDQDQLARASNENEISVLKADISRLDQYISDCEHEAIDDTKTTLGQVEQTRGQYSATLQKSLTTLRIKDGYDPAAIQGLDSDGKPSRDQQDHKAVDTYNADQCAKDRALVDSPGPMTAEKADAAARLRDYATATNPAANADARRLASERLDDFNLAHFTGPLPVDPILGGDARSRAQMRLEWQKKLEQGFAGGPPMSPDQVTQMLDNSEQQARVVVTREATKALEHQGLSPSGASSAVARLVEGLPLTDLAHYNTTLVELSGAGMEHSAASISTGRHNLPEAVGALSPADAEALERIGKRLGRVGSVAQLALAGIDISEGAPASETMGKAIGGIAGGEAGAWAVGALGGMAFGPGGAFVGGLVGLVLGGLGGEKLGGAAGSQFDH